MGTEGLATIAKKVLIHQMTLPMPIEDYRKVLQLLDSRMISDQAKKQQLVNLMWGGVERVVESVQAKIDIIFLGALEQRGIFIHSGKQPRRRCARQYRLWHAARKHRHSRYTVDGGQHRHGRCIRGYPRRCRCSSGEGDLRPHPSGSKAAFVHPAQQEDEAGYFRHGQIIVATSAGQPKRVYAIERVARIRGDPTDDAHSGQWQDPRIQTVE